MRKWFRYSALLILSAVLLFATGCLERTEEIIVHPDGTTEFNIIIEGDTEEFSDEIALPDSSQWQITLFETNKGKNKNKLKLKAGKTVPYNEKLPYTFATQKNIYPDLQLTFPTTIKTWRDGDKTYYEFKRTYQSRDYQRYYGPEEMRIDEKLEKVIIENGIFNVSEKDRDLYLEQLHMQFAFTRFYQYQDALADLIIDNKLTLDQKDSLSILAMDYLEKGISQNMFIDLLQLDDTLIDRAYDSIVNETQARLAMYYILVTEADQKNEKAYFDAIKKAAYKQTVTEKLTGHSFSIGVHLPGHVIKTNGFTDPDEPGNILWKFNGSDLHDRNLPLYALSVVEN